MLYFFLNLREGKFFLSNFITTLIIHATHAKGIYILLFFNGDVYIA